MNRAACNLAGKKELRGPVFDERLYRQKGAEARRLYLAKKQVGHGKVAFL